MPLAADAEALARAAHDGQRRKGGGAPYIVHPEAVAEALRAHGAGDELVAAGWLHDAVEDTGVSIEEVRERFGARVAELVWAVSEHDKSLPWETRKREALGHLDAADDDVALLKAADVLSNATDILRDGDAVWARFNRPVASQLWWYCTLAARLRARLGDDDLAVAASRAVDAVCLLALTEPAEEEADAVLALTEELFAPPGAPPARYDRAAAGERLRWWLGHPDRTLRVARDDDRRPVGYVAAAVDIESIRFGRRLWVEDLVVHPDARGRAHGAALLGAARAFGRERGCSHLELDTGRARVDAQRFYDREGGAATSLVYAWALD